MLAYGVLVWLIAVVLIVCAFIVEWRSLDRTLEKLSELPDQRYLLPLGPIGTLCAGSDEAGRDSDIAVGGQRNPPRFTIHTMDATRNGSHGATVLPFSRAVAG